MKLRDVPVTEHLHCGNLACAGCPETLGFRHVLKVMGPNTLVVNGTGCLAVVMQMGVPKVPHFHVLFENAAAVVSGMDDALRAMGTRDRVKLLVVAGDGGTSDIGLSALSGAIERNQDFVYVCFDNESYMNTGGQRSGTTPFGARTSTTPVGRVVKGEDRRPGLRKDLMEVISAHGLPYAASCSIAYPMQLMSCVEKAAAIRGPTYIHCHSPCPTGWGMESSKVVEAARLAVQTGAVVLYEVEDGVRKLSRKLRTRKPIEEYLQYQARFRHVLQDPLMLEAVQQAVDKAYEATIARMA